MREGEPTVAVVIAAYCAEATIDAALASVAAQSRQPDQVIVIDDASTDGTVACVQRWQERLPITLVARTVNGGAGAARRDGFEAVTTELVAILDADDYWLPNHLQVLAALAAEDVIVVGEPIFWSDIGGVMPSRRWATVPPRDEQVREILSECFIASGSLFPIQAVRFGREPSIRRKGQDWETWIDLIVRKGLRAVAAGQVTYLYRIREDSHAVWQRTVDHDIELFETLLADPTMATHRPQLEFGLRRRRARRAWLDANAAAIDGRPWAARRQYLRAATQDRSVRKAWRTGGGGSVTLRALLGVVSPTLAVRARTRHLKRKGLVE